MGSAEARLLNTLFCIVAATVVAYKIKDRLAIGKQLLPAVLLGLVGGALPLVLPAEVSRCAACRSC
jgi:hypothetical protein